LGERLLASHLDGVEVMKTYATVTSG
jgi:hypothetical protein